MPAAAIVTGQSACRAGGPPPAAQMQRNCAQQQVQQFQTPRQCGSGFKLPGMTRSVAADAARGSSAATDSAAAESTYYTNMGAAIRALQQDLPEVLERQPNLEVYAEGVLFEDLLSPRLGLPASSCQGRDAYGRLLWSLRFHRTLFFSRSRLSLERMWEREPGVVCVRWSAAAAPRLLDGLLAAGAANMSVDAISEFHFNERSGLIMKHSVDCVSYSGPRAAQPLLARYRSQALVPGLAGGSWDEC